MYRFEEYEMLANRVISYFDDDDLSCEKSENAIRVARERHDPNVLVTRIVDIYSAVIDDFNSKKRIVKDDKK